MKLKEYEPTIEEIVAWSFFLHGEKYQRLLDQSGSNSERVDLEHATEQYLKGMSDNT